MQDLSRFSSSPSTFPWRLRFASWYILKVLFFQSSFPWPYSLKTILLRMYGARIGNGVILKPRVNIHMPWNLVIGDFSWIGEGVEIYNFATVVIGSSTCVSQFVFLCAASHDFTDSTFPYRHSPISIGHGVWLQAKVFVCPGADIGDNCVVTACSFVSGYIPPCSVATVSLSSKISVRQTKR